MFQKHYAVKRGFLKPQKLPLPTPLSGTAATAGTSGTAGTICIAGTSDTAGISGTAGTVGICGEEYHRSDLVHVGFQHDLPTLAKVKDILLLGEYSFFS